MQAQDETYLIDGSFFSIIIVLLYSSSLFESVVSYYGYYEPLVSCCCCVSVSCRVPSNPDLTATHSSGDERSYLSKRTELPVSCVTCVYSQVT